MTSGAGVVANDQPEVVVDANDMVKGAFVEDSAPFIISAAIHPVVVSTVAFNNTTPNRCIDVDVSLFGIYSTK